MRSHALIVQLEPSRFALALADTKRHGGADSRLNGFGRWEDVCALPAENRGLCRWGFCEAQQQRTAAEPPQVGDRLGLRPDQLPSAVAENLFVPKHRCRVSKGRKMGSERAITSSSTAAAAAAEPAVAASAEPSYASPDASTPHRGFSVLNRYRALLLDSTYRPVGVANWQR